MSFLQPALLLGTLLFAVPLVIHLLNRQQHKRREWAAMEFLLRAYKKQRRRLRRENLLLLLLRCLIPILLALAVARPVLREAAALLGGGGAVHHVFVLDASYSMGLQRDGGQSAFDRGRAMAARALERLEGQRDDNPRVTLVSAGVRPRVLARADLDVRGARAEWLALARPEDGAADLAEAMGQVAALVEESTDPEIQVYVLTDLQARALGSAMADPAAAAAAGPELRDTLKDQFDRIRKVERAELHLVDVGPFAEARSGGRADNVQLRGLRLEQPVAVVRVPATVVVSVKNTGTSPVAAQVTLDVDGSEPMRKAVNLDPGAEGEAEFQLVFRETGRRRLHAALQGDGLTADDDWFASVEVRERVRVLLVDGASDEDPLRTNAWLWRSILDPTGGKGPPDVTVFDVTATDTLALLGGQVDPAAFDVTVLADVDRLNPKAVEGIQRALAAGRGVLAALGEGTDLASWNLALHGAGEGPMPFRLQRVAGAPPGTGLPVSTAMVDPDHPALREFDEDVYREILGAIPVYRWVAAPAEGMAPDARVLLQLNDADRSPLLVARTVGEGKAAFWLSGPASEYVPERWNRFDDPLVAFHLLHGLTKWLALPAFDPCAVQVGGELTATVPARPAELEVQRPERDGGSRTPLADEPRPLSSGRFALPPFTQTLHAGFYLYEMGLEREAGRERLSIPFAVNVDPEEGDLRYAAHEDVRTALGIERVLTAMPTEGRASVDPQRSELGPSFLMLLLLFVLGEAAMARFVSVRRS